LVLAGNRVAVYSPHTHTDESKVELRYLNINRELKALHSAKLEAAVACEMLLVGSPTHILAYNVEENRDIFLKEVASGLSSIAVGKILQGSENALCLVGGNCSIEGFDHKGEEQFWTVAGDFVGTMEVCDVNGDGVNELIAGTDDNEIRICTAGGDMLCESKQTDKVTFIKHIEKNRFAFGLANGTVGVYDYEKGALTRKWRVKSKHALNAVAAFDMTGDGKLELVIGWSNGRVEVRNSNSGEVVAKDSLDHPIAAILKADFRMDGRMQVIVLSVEGELRGYVQNLGVVRTKEVKAEEQEQELIALQQTKTELLCELKNYEDNMRHMRTGQMKQGEGQLIMIPTDTEVTCQWRVDPANKCVNLRIATNNKTIVRAVVIFADQLFPGESLFVCPKEQLSELLVPLAPEKDIQSDLFLKVFVGLRNSNLFHYRELNFRMPRFSMYIPLPATQEVTTPEGSVTFDMGTSASKLADWLNSSFNIQFEKSATESLSVSFQSLRDDSILTISVNVQKVQILTNSMELAGDLVQDLAEFSDLKEVQSTASFPAEMTAFASVVTKVDEHNATRLSLAADSAELSGRVKEAIVRAEDCRLLAELAQMRTGYTRVMDMNRELVAEHMKRYNNQQALLDALKQVNHMIQKAARLRVGTAKTGVIAACRDAIKTNKIALVLQIIQSGKV
jgi:Bardet-Biedl syndrome 2 protein